jgi:uncharacterized protein (TIGR02217 family)
MAYWLAKRRTVQQADYIQRFDPRFWTVNFPRPAMAAATTPAPDTLRIDAVFQKSDDLVGVIWESEDKWDHPLLAYETRRDYARLTLSFRWRSAGLIALDAVNGPTLTIEGRDAAGAPRTWYVRLWNYAQGSPTDAQVTLRFSDLAGGFVHPAEADPVHPADIDRLFISLVPPGYAPSAATPFPVALEGWAELSEVTCQGHEPMLAIGDVMVPPHGLSICTGYDDAYNQTPARLLRMIRGLGYRGSINHYIGMSHFYRLSPDGAGGFVVDPALPAFNAAAEAWHDAFFALARARGHTVIGSQSYEVLAQNCPAAWQQRYADGTPARTGWMPPSALLSPAHAAANAWLAKVAVAMAGMLGSAGLPVRYQVGEPWWWTASDGRIALYDEAAKAAFGGTPPAIEDLHSTALTPAQLALLDQAGVLLAQSTAGLVAAVRAAAAPAPVEALLLVYLPTVLDPAMPAARRANLPTGWATPAFDVLQIEDYDWVTGRFEALHEQGRAIAEARLGYPRGQQHYLSGFVLDPANEAQWSAIDAAASETRASGVAETFVWALPQVCRDGFTRLPDPPEDDDMQAFDDLSYPLPLGRGTTIAPEFSTQVMLTASGHERRNSLWSNARLRFDVGPGIRSETELGTLVAFFRARRGLARGFRLEDPSDFSSAGMTDVPTPQDQVIGTGDGARARFELVKSYGGGDDPQPRRITRPRAGTIRVSVNGTETTAFLVEPLGTIRLDMAPPIGAVVRAGFEFDVPVRFAEDRLDISSAAFAAGEAPSVMLVEIREDV